MLIVVSSGIICVISASMWLSAGLRISGMYASKLAAIVSFSTSSPLYKIEQYLLDTEQLDAMRRYRGTVDRCYCHRLDFSSQDSSIRRSGPIAGAYDGHLYHPMLQCGTPFQVAINTDLEALFRDEYAAGNVLHLMSYPGDFCELIDEVT